MANKRVIAFARTPVGSHQVSCARCQMPSIHLSTRHACAYMRQNVEIKPKAYIEPHECAAQHNRKNKDSTSAFICDVRDSNIFSNISHDTTATLDPLPISLPHKSTTLGCRLASLLLLQLLQVELQLLTLQNVPAQHQHQH